MAWIICVDSLTRILKNIVYTIESISKMEVGAHKFLKNILKALIITILINFDHLFH